MEISVKKPTKPQPSPSEAGQAPDSFQVYKEVEALLQERCARQEEEILRLREREGVLSGQFVAIRSAKRKLEDSEIPALRGRERDLETRLAELESDKSVLESELRALTERNEAIQEMWKTTEQRLAAQGRERDGLLADLLKKEEEIRHCSGLLAKTLGAVDALRVEKNRGDILIEETESALKTSERARSELESRFRALERELEASGGSKAALDRRAEALARQEARMAGYAELQNERSSALRRIARQAASQFEAMASAHPLKDYLALTERELARVEAELNRMPASAEARPELEALQSRLLAQRAFLRDSLSEAVRALELGAQSALALALNDDLEPLPPPFQGRPIPGA